jgi:glycosyltransferase involved in cell wall biosynthesis
VDAVEDEVTGLLVPPRDAQALEQAIRRYLDSPALRQQHGKAGRERVLRLFRQEVIWEALYNEYVALLQRQGILPAEGHAR